MNWNYFIGIDVSKLTLDICIVSGKQKVYSTVINNDPKSLAKLWRELPRHLPGYSIEESICCMEHTGIYNEHLLSFLTGLKVAVSLENATHIKLSSGLTRGKNDQVDAERIAIYAYKERESLKLWEPPRNIIKRLKHLSVLRIRLIDARKSIVVPQRELKGFDKGAAKMMEGICKHTLKAISRDLKAVEDKISQIIKQDEILNRLFNIVTSVSGIGAVSAVEIIITTNEFKNINTAPKFACYAGIVPFQHTSGTSVQGRTRVSHRANKRMKTLLHMASLVAITHNQEIRAYYQRKVSEGKNKMSVINAVRNKLVQRVFSCILGDRKYEKDYLKLVA